MSNSEENKESEGELVINKKSKVSETSDKDPREEIKD
jgi:hypothetical protein